MIQLNLLDSFEDDDTVGGFNWPNKNGNWTLICQTNKTGHAPSVSHYRTYKRAIQKAFLLINETPDYWAYISVKKRSDRNE